MAGDECTDIPAHQDNGFMGKVTVNLDTKTIQLHIK